MNKKGNPVTLVTHSRDNQAVADAMLARQDAFLDAYRKHGTIRKGCQLASLNRDTIRRWRNEDVFAFNARFRDAHEDFITLRFEEYLDALLGCGLLVLRIVATFFVIGSRKRHTHIQYLPRPRRRCDDPAPPSRDAESSARKANPVSAAA